jgi:integrase
MTVAECLEYYRKEHLEYTCDPKRAGIAIRHLLKAWPNRTVASLKKLDFERYRQRRGAANSTVNREFAVLSAAIRYAHKADLVEVTPHIPRTAEQPRTKWMQPADVEKLLAAARTLTGAPHLEHYILLAVHTGQRKEAILSLRWDQVDLATGIIHFNDPTMWQAARRKHRGTVPISETLGKLLFDLQANRGPGPYVLTHNGERIKDIEWAWAKAVEIAGLVGYTPHSLRHTVATNLLRAGRPLLEVSKLLGHRDSSITERVYGHFCPDFVAQSVSKLDELFGR